MPLSTRKLIFLLTFFVLSLSAGQAQAAAPTITSLSPTTGAIGASVTITGTNFSTTPTSNTVTFNGTAATVKSATATTLAVTVPTGAATGSVIVTVAGVASGGKTFTVVAAPSITSLSPASGAVGASVTITGTSFGTTIAANVVTFNGTTATATSASKTKIVVPVPSGATTGNVVVFASGVDSNGFGFTVLPTPTLISLSPTSGHVGASVTVTGTNFSTTPASDVVEFNGTKATVTSATATTLVVTVPSGATTGNVVVSTSGVNTNGIAFTVLPTPTITSLSLTSGAIGASVTITGTNFSTTPTSNTVTFNGTAATVISATTTTLAVTVPTGATTGSVIVTVAGVASKGKTFTVVAAPSITSLSPTSGAVGVSVTITGTNFGTTIAANVVTFNGTTATLTSASKTKIVVPVPTGATTGNVVVFASGVNSNGMIFTVPLLGPTITSLSPNAGSVGSSVTITGTNFSTTLASNNVTFNGAAATVTSATTTSLSVTVPTNATTGNVVVAVGGLSSNGMSFTVTVSAPSILGLSPTSGPVGAFVTITGSNFGGTQGTNTVKFNGTVATPTSWSATSIVVPVPMGATSGNVIVTVSGTASNGSPFTVITLTSVAVTPVSPVISTGNTLQFTATGTYSDNSTQNLTAAATWTSSATGVATVSSSGLATGIALGQTTIQAVVGTIQGSTVLTVQVQGFTSTVSLGTGRNGQTATVLNNGTVLVVGGFDINGNALASAELFSPTGAFTPTGTLNTGRTNHTATLLDDGTVLIVGGLDINGNLLVSAEIYNPATAIFTPIGGLGTARANHTATILANGMVLIAGSDDNSGNASASAELYNPATGTFTATGSLNTARGFQTAVLLDDGTVLVLGGSASGSVLASAELYNPASGVFAPAGTLNTGRDLNSTTLLNTGMVLVAGGKDINGNTLASAELYNPASKSFTVTGTLNIARGSHAATLLNNGMVLVEGGFGATTDMLASAELYDPVATSFTQTGSLNVARKLQTSTLLSNGKVLVAGGFSDSTHALSSAELFQPASLVPASLVSVAVGPLNPSIPAGAAQSFVATGTFSDNSAQTLASVIWSSSNSAIATVSSDSSNRGVALGVASGAGTVSACAGSICGSTIATVVPPDPSVTSLSPNSFPVGASAVIAGLNFGAIEGTSTVTFNQTVATVTSWSPTSIVATVPNETTGNVVVQVGGVTSNLVGFTVLPTPVIASLLPISGDVGSEIEISGANFGETQGSSTATLNGTPITVTTWSATNISGTVPAGAATGNVVVSVTGVASNPQSFTVTNALAIFSLSPSSGPVGTLVTITGSDFGATQGLSTVAFNGIMASVTGWSSTSISSVVPTGATTGPLVLNVGGTASNGVVFVIPGSPNVASISPATAPVGVAVTVSGTNFGATQGTSKLSFNGTLATATSWSPTVIVVTVPSGATSGAVTVTASGVTGTAVLFNVFSGPIVDSISPAAGTVGRTVIIQGSGFGATQGSSTVTFNGIPATLQNPADWSDGGIGVAVPTGATTGPLNVTVFGITRTGGTFTVFPIPVISSVLPTSGVVGTSITITGSGFGATQGSGGVGFSGACCLTPATSWSDTQIVIPVPAGAASGGFSVQTSGIVGQITAVSNPFSFTVLPSISNLSPTSGTVGTSIQINGNGFGFEQDTSTVTFNGKAASPTSWSTTQIVTNPPVGATTGSVVVTVGGTPSAGVNFTVQPGPAISSLSPSDGATGISVTISGTGFGSAQGSSTVTFNGTAATPSAWSGTSITVPVPTGASTGTVVVTVAGVASNGVSFTIDPTPSISSLSQTSGSIGTSITINGSNFLNTQGSSTVSFNGINATINFWSAFQIGVNVPSSATTGNVVVTVVGQVSAGVKFTVTAAPSITSLSPVSGPAGTLVTINGTSFGSSQGTSSVAFNGLLAAAASWASGKITVAVPEGATTGPVIVTVNNGSSTGSTFTITSGPGITSVSPASGGFGATVTITGALFASSQGSSTVKFNGTAAAPSSWSDTIIVVPVPTGATTGNIVVTVGGAATNGVNFTVSSGLSVAAVSPNSGNTGNTVTITGAGFGSSQGSSTIKFNGTIATAISWTNASITTSVPAAATSGPLVITVGGASSDGVYFTAQPQIDGISPNPAAQGATVTITGKNFGTTQGSSSVTCNGVQFGPPIVTWSATSVVIEECTNFLPSSTPTVPVQITVNGISSTIASITLTPFATLTRVSPTSGPVGTPILIRGTNLGASQGQSSVTLNGAAVTPTNWSNTTIVATVPAGATSGSIEAIVGGNVAESGVGFSVQALSGPNSLQITPAGVNMLIGGSKQFVVLDDQQRRRYDATWTIDNASLATITTASSPTLTALAAGTVTLTATVQAVSAQMPVTISALTAFSPGTILWSGPPVPGFSPLQVVQAMPSTFGPSSYSLLQSGTQTVVQAFTSDGQEMWQTTMGKLSGTSVPDGFGGLLVTQPCTSASPMTTSDLDAFSGTALWQVTITPADGGGSGCPVDLPKIAIRQDGAVVIAAPANTLPSLLVIDGQSGELLATPSIPTTSATDQTGEVVDLPATMGSPIVDTDGSIYEEYEIRDIPYPPTSLSSIVWLLKLGMDGSTSLTQLSSSNSANLFPGTLMPDGNGGVLATWTIVPANPPAAPQPYQAAYVSSGSIVNTYSLPMAPTQVLNGASGVPVNPALVLGENGTAFISYPLNVVSFLFASGAPVWSYSAPAQTSPSMITLAPSNSLTIKTTDATGTDTISRLDAGGKATTLAGNGTDVSYSWQGAWNAFANGLYADIAIPFVPVNTVSAFAAPGGSSSSNGMAVVRRSFGLFWCGTGYALQGYLANSPCVSGGGNDVRWGYYPASTGISAFQDFSSAHPEWAGIILSQAFQAFQKAYVPYGIQVNLATQTAGNPDQNFTAFVLGTYPYPTAGQRFLGTPNSGVYYFYFMENAQTALGQPETPGGAGWISLSPTYPPGTTQATANFISIMKAIGTAIGNAAAHEMGHQLETITSVKSNGYAGLPFMDCGLGNHGDQNRPKAISCEGDPNDNFVYGFYTADGFPQYPGNATSTGGMFFYGIPGGQNNIPLQTAIHWGPSDVCWIQNYALGNCSQ